MIFYVNFYLYFSHYYGVDCNNTRNITCHKRRKIQKKKQEKKTRYEISKYVYKILRLIKSLNLCFI